MIEPRMAKPAYLLTAMAIVLALFSAMMPARASAQSMTDYESDEFGYSVEWDEEVWSGDVVEEDGYAGVDFDSVSSYGAVSAFYVESGDSEDCLNDFFETFAEDEGAQLENFGIAPIRMERPEPILGAEAELYTYTFVGDQGDVDLDQVLYMGCLPLLDGEALLQVLLATTPDVYDDVWTEWDDLIGGIVVDEEASGDASSRDREADDESNEDEENVEVVGEFTDGSYVNDAYGVEITWDEELWEAVEVAEDDGSAGVILDSGASYLHMHINAHTYVDAAECLDDVNANFEAINKIEDFDSTPRRMDRPETDRAVEGDLYTFWNVDEEVEMVIYNGCQVLTGGNGFSLQFMTVPDEYETELPYWQDVIDQIEITEPSRDSDAQTRDHNSELADAEDLFVTENFGLEIAYDPAVWSIDDQSVDGSDQLEMESEGSLVFLVVTESDQDLDSCVDGLAELERENSIDGEIEIAPSRVDRPETARGAVGELYSYTFDYPEDPFTLYAYIECREVDGGVMALGHRVAEPFYEEELPALEALLAGIDA